MKNYILGKKYEGLGFVEALIALTVSGIVSVVLMNISISTLRELSQLDVQDTIAQHAVSTSVVLQKIAIQDMTRDEKVFEGLAAGSCYGFNLDGSIRESGPVSDTRSSYSQSSLVEEDSEYFRIFCLKNIDSRKALVEIIVGSNKVAGKVTTDNDIKDYSYLAIINR